MSVSIKVGDCREVLPTLAAESIDACVTDPPYGLGFMGKDWDHGIPGVHFWQEVLRVLKPGAHLVAFGGTRTHHRLMCAIEDAGFEIRDCLGWLYGSGFPKSLDVSKAIDKAAGAEREMRINEKWAEKYPNGPGGNLTGGDRAATVNQLKRITDGPILTSDPVTDSAKQWQGWGTALKPAWEPIILARKPLVGTVAANVQEHGTGAMNIDGCRVQYAGTEDAKAAAAAEIRSRQTDRNFYGWGMKPQELTREAYLEGPAGLGRWTANLAHDGSEEVLAVFPESDGQSGIVTGNEPSSPFRNAYGEMARYGASHPRGDSGSAARFFYCAKASREDRNAGLSGFVGRPLNWSSGEQSPGTFQSPNTCRIVENHHPTVKPTDLMRWLCRLVTPPGGLILDPFMGSGSTGKAAQIEGFRFIGIELDPDYAAIAEARIRGDSPLFAQVQM